jgi:hypothetical protein
MVHNQLFSYLCRLYFSYCPRVSRITRVMPCSDIGHQQASARFLDIRSDADVSAGSRCVFQLSKPGPLAGHMAFQQITTTNSTECASSLLSSCTLGADQLSSRPFSGGSVRPNRKCSHDIQGRLKRTVNTCSDFQTRVIVTINQSLHFRIV